MAKNKHSNEPMNTVVQELQHEISEEKLYDFWKKYSKKILCIIIFFLIILGVYLFYQEYQSGQRQLKSQRFLNAVQTNDIEALRAITEDVDMAVYQAMATLHLADYYLSKGDVDNTLLQYHAIIKTGDVTKPYYHASAIKYGYLALAHNKQISPQVLKVIQHYADASIHWQFSAREVMGLHYHKLGDKELANKYLEDLANDPNAPQTLQYRAGLLLQ
jgi:hypothetical protein